MAAYQPHDPSKVTKNHIFLVSNLNWSNFRFQVGTLFDLMFNLPGMTMVEGQELLDKGGVVLQANNTLIQTFNYEVGDIVEIGGKDHIIDSVFTQSDPITGQDKLLVRIMDNTTMLGFMRVEDFEDFDRCIENDTYKWRPAGGTSSFVMPKYQTFRASGSLEIPDFKYEEDKQLCTCSSYDLFHFGCKCGGK